MEFMGVLEKIADEVIFEWEIERLEQLASLQEGSDIHSEFEAGVEALKLKLIEMLSPEDVLILEIPSKEQKENEEPT